MRTLLRAAILLVTAAQAEAGPWASGKGHYYAKLGYQHGRATRLAQPDGTVFKIPRFTQDDASFYGTYGVSESVDVFVDVLGVRSNDLQDFRRETGFGDLKLGLQHQFARRGSWVFAVRGRLQAPTGDETRADGILATGSGVWEGRAILGAGGSLAGGKLYAFAEAGYDWRGGRRIDALTKADLRDGIAYEAQLGWNVTKRVILIANGRGVEPFDSKPPRVASGSPVGVSDRVTFVMLGPSLIVKLGRGYGLQLDVEKTLHVRNMAKGTVFRAGASFSR